MQIRDGQEFVLVVSDRRHQASFLDIGPSGEFLFSITARDHPHLQSHSGHAGHLIVTIGDTRYIYTGKVSSMSEDRAAFFSPLLIGPERRKAHRYGVPSVPATLREKGLFRPRTTQVFVINISLGGAALASTTPLEPSKVCELTASVIVHHSAREYSSVVSIRYCRPERRGYISGVRFEEMPPPRETLEKFIRGLESG